MSTKFKVAETKSNALTPERIAELEEQLRQELRIPAPVTSEKQLSPMERVVAGLPQEEQKGRTPREGYGPLPWLAAGATRIGTGFFSNAGGVPGATISGLGEIAAQKMESADPVNYKAVGTEAALGAVPLRWVAKAIKAGASPVKQGLANAARMAGFIEGGNMARRAFIDNENPIPDTLGEAAFDLGTSGIGAALGYKFPPKAKAGPQTVLDTLQGREVDPVRGPVTSSWRVSAPVDDIAAELPATAPREVNTPSRLVKNPELKSGAKTSTVPSSIKGSDQLGNYEQKGAARLRIADPRPDPDKISLGAYRAEDAGRYPLDIQLKLDAIDARRSKVPAEWLDANGKPITPQAEQWLAQEHAEKEAAKRAILARLDERVNVKPAEKLAKAEEAADRENLRNRVGGTDAGKIRIGVAKAENQATKEVVEKEKAHTTANTLVKKEAAEAERATAKAEKAERVARAQAIIDKELANREPGEMHITETTEAVPTASGSQRARQSYYPKKDDEGYSDITDDADFGGGGGRSSKATATKPKNPIIPKTDPNVVAATTYKTKQAAMHAAAGSGKRAVDFPSAGKGKWSVVFADDAAEAGPKTPEPPAPAAPKAPEPEPPKTPPAPSGAQAEANIAAKAEQEATQAPTPYKEPRYGGPERRGPSRVVSEAEDLRYKVMREAEARKNVEAQRQAIKADVKPQEPPTPPAEPKPAPVRPKPAPKSGGGAAAKAPQKPVEAPKTVAPTPTPAKAPEAPVAAPEAPAKPTQNRVTAMKKREIDAVTREDVKDWTPAEIKEARVKYPKDKRLMTILNDEVARRKTAPEAPNENVGKHPVGSTVRIGDSEGKVVGHGPSGVSVNFSAGRLAKEQGDNPHMVIDSKRIESTTVPPKEAPKAAPKPEPPATPVVIKQTSDGEFQVIRRPQDNQYQVINKKKNSVLSQHEDLADAEKHFNDLEASRAKETPKTVAKEQPKAEPAPKAPTKVTVDLTGAKDAKEVKNRVVKALEDYRAKVQKYEDSRGVDEKGKYTYGEENPGSVSIEVPNGPTYTFKPDLQQIDNALGALSSGRAGKAGHTTSNIKADTAFKGIVDKPSKTRGSIPTSTNWGSAEKPSIAKQADSDKLGISADIIEHDKVVGPKAATAEFAPKNASVVKAVDNPADLPNTAVHAAYVKDKDGITHLFVSEDPNHLKRFVDDWKDKVESERGKYAVKHDVKEGTLPEGKTWESYLTENKLDTSKIKFAVVGEGSYKPIEPPPTGGGVKPTPKTGLRVASKDSPTTGLPEKGAKQASPLAEGAPSAPAKSIEDLMLEEKAAWDKYWSLKEAKGDPTEIRAAGKTAGEIRAQLAQAAKDARARGEAVPTYAQTVPEPVAKIKAPAGKGPTNEDIAKMDPTQQESALKQVVEEFKRKTKKGGGTTLGAGFGGLQDLYERDPEMFTRVGLSAVGAIAGASQTPDDLPTGAILGGSAGFFGPSVYRAVAKHVKSLPEGSPARQQGEKALAQRVQETISGIVHILPDYYRASYLARFPNIVINAAVGPYGAAMMGAAESAMFGDPRGMKAIKLLLSKQVRKEIMPAFREARKHVTDVTERGDMSDDLGSGLKREILTAPATAMTTGDMVARRILMQAGFSELEARRFTLTSEPVSGLGASLGAFSKKKGPTGKHSPVKRMMLPFYRTAMNQIEQSALRTPGLGKALRKHWNLAPAETRQLIAQYGITTAAMGGAAVLGYNTPPEWSPVVLKVITNFAGPYGATAGAAFMSGVAAKNSSVAKAIPKGMFNYVRQGLPIPTADVIQDWINILGGVTEGKVRLPYGTIPPPLSSKEKFSVAGLSRMLGGDPEWRRPTKEEYGPVPQLFNSRPKLAPKPKTAYERKLDQIKAEKARQRKAAREAAEQ